MLANVSELAVLPCCASCRFARSFTEKVAWDVDYRKPPSLFRRGFKICLDEDFHSLLAGINFDADRRVAKIDLMSATVLPTDNCMGHFRVAPFRIYAESEALQFAACNAPSDSQTRLCMQTAQIAALTEAILPSSSEAPSVLFRVADECLVFNGAGAFGMATRIRPR